MKASSYAEVVMNAIMRSQAFFFLTLFFVFVQFILMPDGVLIHFLLVSDGTFVPHGAFLLHGFLVAFVVGARILLKNKMSVKGRDALYTNSP